MTDLRAILDEQLRATRRVNRLSRGFATFCALMFVVMASVQYGRGKEFRSTFGLLFPLIFVGGVAAAYTPKHLKALQDAIDEPDPGLDPHFARILTSEQPDAAALARKAFVQRFERRVPALDDAGWTDVARGLSRASLPEADRMLALLKAGGTPGALAPLKGFEIVAKDGRLKTAALATQGEIRLRTARDRVLGALGEAETKTGEESARLGLGAS